VTGSPVHRCHPAAGFGQPGGQRLADGAASGNHRAPAGAVALPPVDAVQLARLYPTLYHMAEDGSWPSIRDRGLLSTRAIVDLYQPGEEVKAEILTTVRRRKVTLTRDELPDATIRDQVPAKFLDACLEDGVTRQEYLDALNGRVFFWLSAERLTRLLQAKLYRKLRQTVLQVDTAALVHAYSGRVQLAPYNTGSMHVPSAPKRGPGVFTSLADYPYDEWARRRGRSGAPVVELTIDYAVPDVFLYVTRAETWADGKPVEVLYSKAA